MSALHPAVGTAQRQLRPAFTYERRRPELTDLHAAVRMGWPQLREAVQEQTGEALPQFVRKGFAAYLTCGQLPKGFARFCCGDCRKDILVAFSCKVRGLCPSCDGKRMIEEAEHITGAILPHVPYRQWVLTLPYALRYSPSACVGFLPALRAPPRWSEGAGCLSRSIDLYVLPASLPFGSLRIEGVGRPSDDRPILAIQQALLHLHAATKGSTRQRPAEVRDSNLPGINSRPR